MNWTRFALGIVNELIRISTAIDLHESRPTKVAVCAKRIRDSSRRSQELATRFEMLEGQTPQLPDDEIRNAWRTAIPGAKRCGVAVQASAHEIAFCNGIDAFNLITCYHNIIDSTLVERASQLLDATLDRKELSRLKAMIHIEGAAAVALASSTKTQPTRKPVRRTSNPLTGAKDRSAKARARRTKLAPQTKDRKKTRSR